MRISENLRKLFGGVQTYNISFTPTASPVVEGLSARRLYATQANLHAVVSFLSDSIAQLPLKVYTRNGENDRERDRDSVAAQLLWRPNADQTSYELINGLATELFLMGVAVLWLLPDADSTSGYQLRIIPREWIQSTESETNYAPSLLRVSANSGRTIEIPRDDFVMFRMYDPGNPGSYQSPISALKQTLSEQIQADRFRTEVWSSSGRFNAYVTRPKDVQPWDDGQRERFITAFREAWGPGGENKGKMPLLEDGMEIKPYQFNAKEAQYAETKQLSREDVAAAYHVNPSLIWHNNTQTYASAKDNARALYADCLGPTIQMIQQRLNSFLLPMVGADPNTYVEFDMAEKLKGSFEERASILQSAVGGPYMTRNEARADNNLPPVEGGDELIVPLNVTEGGQASPQDTHMDEQVPMTTVSVDGIRADLTKACDCPECKADGDIDPVYVNVAPSDDENELMAETLSKFFKRQADSVLPKIGAKSATWWNEERWNTELAEDLEPVFNSISDAHGKEMADALKSEYDTEVTRPYLKKKAKGMAEAINTTTYEKLKEAVEYEGDDEEEAELHTPAHVMEEREGVDADRLGSNLAKGLAGWAMLHEAVQQSQRQGSKAKIMKKWVTGANPRATHAMMNGETVGVDEYFSNGMDWPGDDNAAPEETCGCNCTTMAIITW